MAAPSAPPFVKGGHRTTLEILFASELQRHERARPLRRYWVNRLIREWQDDEDGVLIVSRRADGTNVVLAGNHRWQAQVSQGNYGYPFSCKVLHGLSRADEARIYLAEDARRLRHTAGDDFPARVEEGDPIAVQVKDVLDTLGLQVAPYGGAGFQRNRIRAVSGLLQACESNGKECLRQCLLLVKECWGREVPELVHSQKSIYSQAVILSLSTFLRLYGDDPQFNLQKLKGAMIREGLAGFETRYIRQRVAAQGRPLGGLAALYGVLAFVDLYSHGLHQENKLSDLVAREAALHRFKAGGASDGRFAVQTRKTARVEPTALPHQAPPPVTPPAPAPAPAPPPATPSARPPAIPPFRPPQPPQAPQQMQQMQGPGGKPS